MNLTDNVAWIKEKDLFNDSKVYISMKADEKGLIDQKKPSDTHQSTSSIFLRTECAEIICQIQLQRKTEQQIMLFSEGFRKSAFDSFSNVYIQDSIKFDQIYSDIDTRQLTELRLWQHITVNLVCISQSQLRSVTKELSKMRATEWKALKKVKRLQHEMNMSVNVSFYTQVFLYIDMKINSSFS